MSIMIPLSRIHDNPYQPRQDYPDVEELAGKILALKNELPATLGLIHPPNVRLVDGAGQPLAFDGELLPDDGDWAVQIAEGHRRLRAFHLLAEKDPDYKSMPITILDLDDRTMDDIAWDENKDRRDLDMYTTYFDLASGAARSEYIRNVKE